MIRVDVHEFTPGRDDAEICLEVEAGHPIIMTMLTSPLMHRVKCEHHTMGTSALCGCVVHLFEAVEVPTNSGGSRRLF